MLNSVRILPWSDCEQLTASDPVRIWTPLASRASWSASTRTEVPPSRAVKTGSVGSVGDCCCCLRSARVKLPPPRAAAKSCGVTACKLSLSTFPALIPPIKGATTCSTSSRPYRSVRNSPMDTSPVGAGQSASTSERARSMAAAESSPLAASDSKFRGTPSTVSVGRNRSSPPRKTWARPTAG